jgi:hypothetical protein
MEVIMNISFPSDSVSKPIIEPTKLTKDVVKVNKKQIAKIASQTFDYSPKEPLPENQKVELKKYNDLLDKAVYRSKQLEEMSVVDFKTSLRFYNVAARYNEILDEINQMRDISDIANISLHLGLSGKESPLKKIELSPLIETMKTFLETDRLGFYELEKQNKPSIEIIKEESVLYELVKYSVFLRPGSVTQAIEKMGLTGQDKLFEIAKIAIQKEGRVAEFIKNYGLTNQEKLFELAEIGTTLHGNLVSDHREQFLVTPHDQLSDKEKSLVDERLEKIKTMGEIYEENKTIKNDLEMLVTVTKVPQDIIWFDQLQQNKSLELQRANIDWLKGLLNTCFDQRPVVPLIKDETAQKILTAIGNFPIKDPSDKIKQSFGDIYKSYLLPGDVNAPAWPEPGEFNNVPDHLLLPGFLIHTLVGGTETQKILSLSPPEAFVDESIRRDMMELLIYLSDKEPERSFTPEERKLLLRTLFEFPERSDEKWTDHEKRLENFLTNQGVMIDAFLTLFQNNQYSKIKACFVKNPTTNQVEINQEALEGLLQEHLESQKPEERKTSR